MGRNRMSRGEGKDLPGHGERIVRAGIRAVDPEQAVRRWCRREGRFFYVGDRAYDLECCRHLYLVGAGKAAASMARALEDLVGDRIRGGVVCVKYGYGASTRRTEIVEGGHPIPDENGMRGARKILDTVRRAREEDLVLCVISGGGSALTPLPAPGLTLSDKQETTRILLACGATIHEVNTVRKHLSDFKGGNLARAAYPAPLVSLILSDVIGDDLDVIASGPTVPDSTTFADCLALFERYGIVHSIPPAVLDRVRKGVEGEVPETPKEGDPVFERTRNLVVGRNLDALRAAAEEAEKLGYRSIILSSRVQGETREVARALCAVPMEAVSSGHPLSPPACILVGGETTVTLRGSGLGGRNTEFVLASALEIEGWERMLVMSVGTDGTDGPTDAAGAWCDGHTVRRAREMGVDPYRALADNDSYRFFERVGGLIKTGPTNTNVMDLRLFLVDV